MKPNLKYYRPVRAYKILTWIAKWTDKESYLSKILFIVKTIDRYLRQRGPIWTCSRVKEIRQHTLLAFAGTPSFDTNTGLSLTKQGYPKIIPLSLRQELIKGNRWVLRLILSGLNMTRSVLGGSPIDISTITTPSSFQLSIKWINWLKEWHREVLKQMVLPTEFQGFHYTTKSGPNGPALKWSVWEALHLPDELLNALRTLAGPSLIEKIETIRSLPLGVLDQIKLFRCKPPLITKWRKLSIKQDTESKSRIFAILDYWSQTGLHRLHNEIFSLLRRFEPDCTFNQNKIKEYMTRFSTDHRHFSFDLKSATDRFPISLQKRLLYLLIGIDKAEAWEKIMVFLPFELQGNNYYFRAGQPLGAYSSWGIFSLTHHFLVWVAAKECNLHNFVNYLILGDDILISDAAVARRYQLLLEELGVEISWKKSYTNSHLCEFAKRLFYKGEEITGYPIDAILGTYHKYHLLAESLEFASHRGYNWASLWTNPCLKDLLQSCIDKRSSIKLVRYLIRYLVAYHNIPKGTDTGLGLVDKANNLIRSLRLTGISCNQETNSKWLGYISWFALRDSLMKDLDQKLKMIDLWTNFGSEYIPPHLIPFGTLTSKDFSFDLSNAFGNYSVEEPINFNPDQGPGGKPELPKSYLDAIPILNMWDSKLTYQIQKMTQPPSGETRNDSSIWELIDGYQVIQLPEYIIPDTTWGRTLNSRARFLRQLEPLLKEYLDLLSP